MNINDLFCTPEQGRRLAELVPELKYHYEWAGSISGKWSMFPKVRGFWGDLVDLAPALTLQELRDVIGRNKNLRSRYDKTRFYYSMSTTAPELAAWVIERLEEEQ